MNSSLSSILGTEANTTRPSLTESRDFIYSVVQKIDEEVNDHHLALLQDIQNECESINVRQAKFEKLLKFTNGMMTSEMRAEHRQLEQDVKDIQKKHNLVDKEVATYRESVAEQYLMTLLNPEIEKIKKSLTSYLPNAASCINDIYYKLLNLDSDLLNKIEAIDNTSAPEEPTKQGGKAKVGCLFLLAAFILLIPFSVISTFLVAGLSMIVFGDGSPYLLILVFAIAGFFSWITTKKIFTYLSVKKAARHYEQEKRNWEIEVKNFNEEKRKVREETVQKFKSVHSCLERYRKGDTSVIEEFISASLEQLPRVHQNSPVISVNFSNSSVIVDYLLPDIDDIRDLPIDVAVKRGAISLNCIKDSQFSKVYNKLVYDIVLAVMHCVFQHEEVECIESVTVNGILDTVDKSVGKPIRICACSLQMNREEFSELNLELIDSYECFRRFKGVAAANIADKVAIKPIRQIQDKDARFVEGYSVASGLQRGTNLATMPWQDFENLIRELFEKLFSKHGGSCKVTRASRDGGVDAVAFNPDPISGGKFIIQAKRYTNLVSPSAVRDLYGTLQHEGANKAILVTTSDYGGDSYSFAKDKPIQLLNGSHLLHYLKEELGMTDVYINLDEAKKFNKEA